MADAKATDSVLGLILLFYGMLGGRAILAIAATYLFFHTETPVSLSLTICCLISTGIIAARHIDIPDSGGQTVDCNFTGLRYWKRPVMIMPAVSIFLPVGVSVNEPKTRKEEKP